MWDEQADVEADAVALIAGALRGEVDRSAAVGVDEHGGDALSQDGAAVLEFRGGEAGTGVRMDVDEARRDVRAAGVDDRGSRRR